MKRGLFAARIPECQAVEASAAFAWRFGNVAVIINTSQKSMILFFVYFGGVKSLPKEREL